MANKVEELFMLQLATAFKEKEQKITLSEAQLRSLHEARAIILEDICKHFSLEELSKKVHLNLQSLKTGFKQLFGVGPFECLMEARLQKARELLIQTDKPIKEIASLVGYKRITSFVTAFSKYFGYTPGSVRK